MNIYLLQVWSLSGVYIENWKEELIEGDGNGFSSARSSEALFPIPEFFRFGVGKNKLDFPDSFYRRRFHAYLHFPMQILIPIKPEEVWARGGGGGGGDGGSSSTG